MRAKLSFFGWYTLALSVLLALLLLTGCANPAGPDSAWSPAYEPAWTAVLDCYAGRGIDTSRVYRPEVTIRTDCRSDSRQQYWQVAPGVFVTGMSSPPGRVEVCPDLDPGALRHEFSHIVGYQVTGRPVVNDSGECFMDTGAAR